MAKAKFHKHALTVKSNNGLLRVISCAIGISKPDDSNILPINAIWDTGASSSVITKDAATKLGIAPTGKAKVSTASQKDYITDSYTVDIFLKPDLRVKAVKVVSGVLYGSFECLIGMDIITLGDFTVTNKDNQTCMTFGIPSVNAYDYVRSINARMRGGKRAHKAGTNFTPPKKKRRKGR